ncbi:MAG: hypothetical protein AAFS07_04350 [Pseudomonadota bacterium]
MKRYDARVLGAALVTTLTLSATAALPAGAEEPTAFDCSFFVEHAREAHPLDYSKRMLKACEALAAYRENLLIENVRYAFGEQVVAKGHDTVMERAAPLDTFQVLDEREQYRIARESEVFEVIIEIPRR